jgi:hypothetical protein
MPEANPDLEERIKYRKVWERLWPKTLGVLGVASGMLGVATALVWLTQKSLKSAAKTQAISALFNEIDQPGYLSLWRPVYTEFCERNFELGRNPSAEVAAKVDQLLRTFGRVGFLIQQGILAENAVPYWADACVKLWIMAEDYINEMSHRQGTHLWHLPLQYVTILSLKMILKTRFGIAEDGLRIYHPTNSSLAKVYDWTYLRAMLVRLEKTFPPSMVR